MRAIRPAATESRSATGSSTLPSSVTWPVRRAIVPSTQSVATTAPNSRIPAAVVSSSTISQQKTGISAMRMKERTFGTVQIADDTGRGPICPTHRSGRPDSNRRPSDPQSDALTKLRHGPFYLRLCPSLDLAHRF